MVLRAYGISAAETVKTTQISERTIRDTYRRAVDRRFDLKAPPLALNIHVDGRRHGEILSSGGFGLRLSGLLGISRRLLSLKEAISIGRVL